MNRETETKQPPFCLKEDGRNAGVIKR